MLFCRLLCAPFLYHHPDVIDEAGALGVVLVFRPMLLQAHLGDNQAFRQASASGATT